MANSRRSFISSILGGAVALVLAPFVPKATAKVKAIPLKPKSVSEEYIGYTGPIEWKNYTATDETPNPFPEAVDGETIILGANSFVGTITWDSSLVCWPNWAQQVIRDREAMGDHTEWVFKDDQLRDSNDYDRVLGRGGRVQVSKNFMVSGDSQAFISEEVLSDAS